MINKHKLIYTFLKAISVVFLYALSILSGGIIGELIFSETIGTVVGMALVGTICLSFVEKMYDYNKHTSMKFVSPKNDAINILDIIFYKPINDFIIVRKLFYLLMSLTYIIVFIILLFIEWYHVNKTSLLTYMCDEDSIISYIAFILNIYALCQSVILDVYLVLCYVVVFLISLFISFFYFVFESYSLFTSDFRVVTSNVRVFALKFFSLIFCVVLFYASISYLIFFRGVEILINISSNSSYLDNYLPAILLPFFSYYLVFINYAVFLLLMTFNKIWENCRISI